MIIEQYLDNTIPEIRRILKHALDSEELTVEEGLKLLKVTGRNFIALQNVANQICFEKKKDIVTFIINRNINFTNICYKKCKFCCFSHSNTHKDSFTLSIEEIRNKIIELNNTECSEVCIQGGINPDLSIEYYIDILRAVKDINSNLHIHAFSPQEIYHLSDLCEDSIENTLKMLKRAGLDSIPGTAAEILNDNIRQIICPNKINTLKWIEIITIAHNLDIPTTSTMMYGHVEKLRDRIEHLDIIRNIQKRTWGITEFIPLPFIGKNTILTKLNGYLPNHCHGMDDIKLLCVARLFLNNYIDNIQCSWVKLGQKLAQISLNYGVNDFSGTLMEENISKSAGTIYGEYLHQNQIIEIIKSAGKRPARRDTLYNIKEFY
ncbi:MAG: 7,8-didemethyl-8-hydroxy-5-deazariboflavin synthase subunit CofH [Candidatus Lokiarchaeota archaeon]|nr:7,8-didemethyl-8-hydroxy-5-deazariboflavin synthase subunit CofH [Candidatus Lokiarchaeota archaeon]